MQQKLFDFLKEQGAKPFELQPLIKAAGYGESSAESSLGEHWRSVVERVGSKKPKQWRTTAAFKKMKISEFQQAITQSKSKRDPVVGQLQKEKAQELAKLARTQSQIALELMNRPGLESRTECFLILFLNAWELLLKAEIVERQGWEAVLEKRIKPDKQPRSIGFKAIVKKLPNENKSDKALRAQLTHLYDLRNQAAHLLLHHPSREMLLDSEFDQQIRANISEYGDEYAIPLRVKLCAVDDESAYSDKIQTGKSLTPSTKAVRDTFKLKRDEVAERVTLALKNKGHSTELREYHVDLVRRKERWDTLEENGFVTQFPAAKLYSDAACNRIVELLQQEPNYLEIARGEEKAQQQTKSKKRSTAKNK